MKKLHILVYLTVIVFIAGFYFNIFTINPQIKNWISNNPFQPPLHHIDTTSGPIVRKPEPIATIVKIDTSNYENVIKLNNIRAIFKNGNDSRYVDGSFDEYEHYREILSGYLYSKFSPNQLKSVSSISLIGWEQLEDNVAGVTHISGYGNASAIDIAAYSGDYYIETVLYHEMFHALQARYQSWFKENLQVQWITIPDFVSDYAMTNIDEDFAETGAHFLKGDTLKPNKKFELIRRFIAYTK